MCCKQKKICFVGLYNEKNLGDPIIFDCTEWLYRHYLLSGVFTSKRIYLDYVQKTYNPSLIVKLRNKLNRLSGSEKMSLYYQKTIFDNTKVYFENSIQGFDLVVIVGGGIVKWTYQFFYLELTALLQTAEKLNIPVVFNAVGVEGYSENNIKCQMLKQAMQLPALIHISTRDDLYTLVNKYYDGNPCRPVLCVADPAVWVSEVYGIVKKDSNIIGLGIARGNLFIDNAIDFKSYELLEFYKSIIIDLVADGHTVEVFTNGLPADNDFADKVCSSLEKEGVCMRKRYPEDTLGLVKIISNYKAIVATRLHSCIIAYSLDVPAVGLVWNDKLSLFGHNIHCEDNFIRYSDFNSGYVVKQLYKAIDAGYDQKVKSDFRQTIVNDILEIGAKTVQIDMLEHIKYGGGKDTTSLCIK